MHDRRKPLAFAPRAAFLILLLGSLSLHGCAWKTVVPPPETDPSTVYVTIRDSTRFELRRAYARGDTLFGSVEADSIMNGEALEELWGVLLTATYCDSATLDDSVARLIPESFCDSVVTYDRLEALVRRTAEADTTVSQEEVEAMFASAIDEDVYVMLMLSALPYAYEKELAIPLADVECVEQKSFLYKALETAAVVVMALGLLALIGYSGWDPSDAYY